MTGSGSLKSSSLLDIMNAQSAVGELLENDIEKFPLLSRAEQFLFLYYVVNDLQFELRLALQNFLCNGMHFIPVDWLREELSCKRYSLRTKLLADFFDIGKEAQPDLLNPPSLILGKIGDEIQITLNIRVLPSGMLKIVIGTHEQCKNNNYSGGKTKNEIEHVKSCGHL